MTTFNITFSVEPVVPVVSQAIDAEPLPTRAEQVMVRLECGAEDRRSKDYGPFDYARFIGLELWVGDELCFEDGERIAYYGAGEGWRCLRDGRYYSDVVIYGVTEHR